MCATNAITNPSAGATDYGFGVSVTPASGWVSCNLPYTVTRKLKEGTTW